MIEDDLAHQSMLTFNPDKTGARPGFHSLKIESKQKTPWWMRPTASM